MSTPDFRWQPLTPATSFRPYRDSDLRMLAKKAGVSLEEMRKKLEAAEEGTQFWLNDLYQVQVRTCGAALVHLNIRRRDGKPIFRDWRHFQQIKNELVGPECEAVELYPAESRKVDTSNKYHLWCVTDSTFRFPVGWEKGDVEMADSKSPGFRQR
jgi:hypothetical protein